MENRSRSTYISNIRLMINGEVLLFKSSNRTVSFQHADNKFRFESSDFKFYDH